MGPKCAAKHCVAQESDAARAYFLHCPLSRFESILRVISYINGTHGSSVTKDLQKSIEELWLEWILENPDESVLFALKVGEKLNLRHFQSEIYCNSLTKMACNKQESSTAFMRLDSELSTRQQLTMYKGYWSLQNYCLEIIRNSLRKRYSSPAPNHACNVIWKSVWRIRRERMMELQFHPIAMLAKVRSDMDSMELPNDGIITCATSYADELNDKLAATLTHHFFDPDPEASESES